MRNLRIIVLAIAALLLGAESATAADGKPEGMKSLAARAAKTQFEYKQAIVEKEFREKMSSVRKEYMAALEKAKDDSTKHADLDEAIAIRAEVDEIKGQDAAPAPSVSTKLARARSELAAHIARTAWTYPSSDSFTFNADGSLTRSDNWTTGAWVPLDEHSVLIVYAKGGMIDKITFEEKFSRVTGISYQSGKTWDARKVER